MHTNEYKLNLHARGGATTKTSPWCVPRALHYGFMEMPTQVRASQIYKLTTVPPGPASTRTQRTPNTWHVSSFPACPLTKPTPEPRQPTLWRQVAAGRSNPSRSTPASPHARKRSLMLDATNSDLARPRARHEHAPPRERPDRPAARTSSSPIDPWIPTDVENFMS